MEYHYGYSTYNSHHKVEPTRNSAGF